MARKKKQKWPPVLFVSYVKDGEAVMFVGQVHKVEGEVEPYVSLTALNKLLATRGIDPIKVVDECQPVVVRGSGNVFADLGLPDADRLLAEARAKIDKD